MLGALQADRPVIACSVAGIGGGNPPDLAITRLTTAGVLDTTFGVGQADSDYYPDAFTFADVTAPYGSAKVQSAPVTILGITDKTSISSGAEYSLGCTPEGFTTQPGVIESGATVCLRQNASLQPGGTAQSTLIVGGRTATFTVISSNSPADIVPDAFTFTDKTDVALSAVTVSNTVTVQGIGGFAPITVSNGAFSVGCDPNAFQTAAATVTNGTKVCVRNTASATPATSTTTTLTIGGTNAAFTTTTVAADTAPDAFAFTDQTGVTAGTAVTSNAITVAGINTAANISVTGGDYSIGCNGTFTSTAGTIQSGQTVCVRNTASTAASTAVNTTLTIGGVTDTFTSTTAAATGGATGNSSGSHGGGGAMDYLALAFLTTMATLLRVVPNVRRRTTAL